MGGGPRQLALLLVSAFHADYTNNFNFPHTESSDAINLLKSAAPGHSGDTEEVVFGTSGGTTLNDPAVGQRINTMVDKINALPNVTHVTSPYDSSGNLVNTDQHQRRPHRRLPPGELRQAAEQAPGERGDQLRPHRHQHVHLRT